VTIKKDGMMSSPPLAQHRRPSAGDENGPFVELRRG